MVLTEHGKRVRGHDDCSHSLRIAATPIPTVIITMIPASLCLHSIRLHIRHGTFGKDPFSAVRALRIHGFPASFGKVIRSRACRICSRHKLYTPNISFIAIASFLFSFSILTVVTTYLFIPLDISHYFINRNVFNHFFYFVSPPQYRSRPPLR